MIPENCTGSKQTAALVFYDHRLSYWLPGVHKKVPKSAFPAVSRVYHSADKITRKYDVVTGWLPTMLGAPIQKWIQNPN